jgi:ascorbate-specific PTS system EIIC-type component UlaA
MVSDWKAIVGFILLAFGGVAFALGTVFATKKELASVKTDIQVHNGELSGIHQAITDFSDNQKQMMDWVRDIYQHPRK